MNNPLLTSFKTPFEATPFHQIKAHHFIPALESTIAIALKEIDEITKQIETPTFRNTLETLQEIGTLVGRNSNLLFNLNSAETNKELQKVAQDAAPLLTRFQNDIILNEMLFKRISYLYKNEVKDSLTPEQFTLLEKEYKTFVRNGAHLNDDAKNKLRILDTELAQLSLCFGENVLADTQEYSLHIKNESELKGLPDNVVETAKDIAQEKGKKGWLFTLDYPSYIPFITYSENRGLRKKLNSAFGKRGFQENKHNNSTIILQIIKLRQTRARLLGYQSHAAFVLEERMAQSEKNVKSFLDNLNQKAQTAAKNEWNTMVNFAKERLGIKTVEKWDIAYVAEKLKKETLDLDEQLLKSYFSLDNVLEGLFTIVEKLYGLSFIITKEIDTYHNEVKVYEVYKEEKFYALLYTDFFPRKGKRNGAWMTSYKSQNISQRPHVSIVCNFPIPTKTKPSLLTFQEVTTLFHEFGHALHGILANTTYSSLSGTSVYWDFVELPSQIMENWCYQSEALDLFAKHHETNEVIPRKFIDKIKKAAYFQQGLQTLRQLSFAYLDLSFHDKNAHLIKVIKNHEKRQIESLKFIEDPADSCMSTAFSHIFQGGYAAGYYSYKWAEVLDADAFELFLEKGVFDKNTAKSFLENILSKGGTEHPMTLYKSFRGKKPDPEALFRRAGLA